MRYLASELRRLLTEEHKMVFIAGPRQVGKTTLAKALLNKTHDSSSYYNWDIESHRRLILKNPEDFWKKNISPNSTKKRHRIVLDEIHKYPRWKRFLKGFFDANKDDAEILVTGSGRLDVYQRGGDSLLGRYSLYHLHPFTLGEMLSAERTAVLPPDHFWKNILKHNVPHGAEEALKKLEKFSGFPEPLFGGSEEKLRRWRRARNHLVIREDLRDLTRIRELGLIEALVELLPERVGSPLSLNALSQTLNVSFNTVRAWLTTLDSLYYIFEVRPFAGSLARTLRKESKVYLYDFTSIEERGARFENLVALHLRKLCDAWNDWGYGDFDLHYVRDKEKHEVDFLITSKRSPFLLIETKLSKDDVEPSLRYFQERIKPTYSLQIVRHLKTASLQKRSSDIFMISAARFLSAI